MKYRRRVLLQLTNEFLALRQDMQISNDRTATSYSVYTEIYLEVCNRYTYLTHALELIKNDTD